MSMKEKKAYLRDAVYGAMCERSKASNVEMIRYIKVDD
jgi:hypothetical protein